MRKERKHYTAKNESQAAETLTGGLGVRRMVGGLSEKEERSC
jgi:hypothetical protein